MSLSDQSTVFQTLFDAVKPVIHKVGFNETGIPGLYVVCRTRSGEQRFFLQSFVSVILQGRKHKRFGEKDIVYGAGDIVVNCIDLPTDSVIEEASEDKPFISILLDLDRAELTNLALQMTYTLPNENTKEVKSLLVEPCPEDVMENFLRLLQLSERPHAISLLAPILKREIHARLLVGSMGASIRSVHAYGTRANQIASAITLIKERFRESISMEELASLVNMSAASFHRHFKSLTGCSPLQYQKELRLHEAKRLLRGRHLSVSETSYATGYASISQFSADYKLFFGITPKEDSKTLVPTLHTEEFCVVDVV